MEVLKGTNWTDHNYQMPLIIADHGYDVADPAWKSNDEKYTFEEYVQGKVAFYQDVTFIAQYKELAYVILKEFLTDYSEKELKYCINSAYDEKLLMKREMYSA